MFYLLWIRFSLRGVSIKIAIASWEENFVEDNDSRTGTFQNQFKFQKYQTPQTGNERDFFPSTKIHVRTHSRRIYDTWACRKIWHLHLASDVYVPIGKQTSNPIGKSKTGKKPWDQYMCDSSLSNLKTDGENSQKII